jgi:hypothetical protein
MFFAALLMLVALAITGVAGYFSILGLMAIFPASPIAVAAMGIVLELAKLVTASWVYRNWKIANKLLKTYFTIAVIVLSFITSMGVFGYLSKAHIEHTTVGGSAQLQIAQLESQKTSAERRLKNAQTSLDTLDRLSSGENILDANFIRNRQKRERAVLNKEIEGATTDIQTIETNLIPLKTESLALEAEVGPIKYVAELFYGSGDNATIDKAVRMMIIILIFVFDPLAILLIIAANMTFLGLTKKEEEHIIGTVEVEEYVPPPPPPTTALKSVVRKVKQNRAKKAKVEEVPDFFKFEKHGSTHDLQAPDPPRRNARGQIIVNEDNIRRM